MSSLDDRARSDAPRTVHVSVMRPTYAPELLDMVRARGYEAALSAADGATVAVETPGDGRDVWLAVEAWLAAESVPLVPVSLGDQRYVLRPPLG
jgi:hypothetical protein